MKLFAQSGLLVSLLIAAGAFAQSPYEQINRVRADPPCPAPAVREPLRRNEALERAAGLLAAGTDLDASLKQAGYRAARSSVVRMASNVPPAELITMFAQRNCALIVEPVFIDIGIHLQAGAITALLAQPFTPQVVQSQEDAGNNVLALVNRARAVARRCGDKPFAAAKPLSRSAMLTLAALSHAADMARNNYLSHDGRDGSNPAQRVERAGYRYRATGENIAAGMNTAELAVESWIKSPQHCANLMSPAFTEMGVAFAIDPRSQMGVYWSQSFGAPR